MNKLPSLLLATIALLAFPSLSMAKLEGSEYGKYKLYSFFIVPYTMEYLSGSLNPELIESQMPFLYYKYSDDYAPRKSMESFISSITGGEVHENDLGFVNLRTWLIPRENIGKIFTDIKIYDASYELKSDLDISVIPMCWVIYKDSGVTKIWSPTQDNTAKGKIYEYDEFIAVLTDIKSRCERVDIEFPNEQITYLQQFNN